MESILKFLQRFNFKLNKFDIVGFGSCALDALRYADSKISNGLRVGKIILVFPHFIESNNIIESNLQDSINSNISNNFNKKLDNLDSILNAAHHPINEIQNLDSKDLAQTPTHHPISKTQNLDSIDSILNVTHRPINNVEFSFFAPNDSQNAEYNTRCYDFTHEGEMPNLADFLSKNNIDLQKISKKSNLFVAFLIENGNIATLKTQKISDFLSQYGICFVMKEHLFA
ncbi:hypothetical protein DCO58_09510 [Helicobacter saguini]|uniref:Uncharacterized protein n=1 Tax=Helicobacter saguini TaxID=1548018 RepID=A0A347VPA3_9HELI|nr:hypothetical protein [Helicobacter saguini]MWV61446.1 hypothetical protein [Helicobacter saguini]MWV67883.1 hypothetical protein [Helicobacter saguini]MWV70648.1 hypothetical protein [Helicobacter saguini]MWV72553.1 hypothetical protein [Helicobacter saguini]TLD94710.1 hypothetical protein LS64_004095 [Helicobacter saguini]